LLGPDPPRDLGALERAVADVAAARPAGAVAASVDALLAEGLLQRAPAGVATRIHE